MQQPAKQHAGAARGGVSPFGLLAAAPAALGRSALHWQVQVVLAAQAAGRCSRESAALVTGSFYQRTERHSSARRPHLSCAAVLGALGTMSVRSSGCRTRLWSEQRDTQQRRDAQRRRESLIAGRLEQARVQRLDAGRVRQEQSRSGRQRFRQQLQMMDSEDAARARDQARALGAAQLVQRRHKNAQQWARLHSSRTKYLQSGASAPGRRRACAPKLFPTTPRVSPAVDGLEEVRCREQLDKAEVALAKERYTRFCALKSSGCASNADGRREVMGARATTGRSNVTPRTHTASRAARSTPQLTIRTLLHLELSLSRKTKVSPQLQFGAVGLANATPRRGATRAAGTGGTQLVSSSAVDT
jgi:hypothetical protein